MSNTPSNDVISVISEVFSPVVITMDSSFEELAADSVLLLRLLVALQRKFDITLDVIDMFTVDDVGDLVRLVEGRLPLPK